MMDRAVATGVFFFFKPKQFPTDQCNGKFYFCIP